MTRAQHGGLTGSKPGLPSDGSLVRDVTTPSQCFQNAHACGLDASLSRSLSTNPALERIPSTVWPKVFWIILYNSLDFQKDSTRTACSSETKPLPEIRTMWLNNIMDDFPTRSEIVSYPSCIHWNTHSAP